MEPLKLKVDAEFNITGRGPVIVIDLKENGYTPITNFEVVKKFRGEKIEYKENLYEIIGVETQGYPEREINRTAFLLKPINNGNIHKV